jgi:hypothetical protein
MPSLLDRTDFRAVPTRESPNRSIQIVIHKTHKPDIVVHFLDADRLAGENGAEVDFFASQADAATVRDHDALVVEGIVDVRQSLTTS